MLSPANSNRKLVIWNEIRVAGGSCAIATLYDKVFAKDPDYVFG
jgi:hypothetical protein